MSLDPRARLTIASPRLRQLHAYWVERCGGRSMPKRGDVDPLDIPRLLPHLLLLEVDRESGRLKVRVAGTNVVDMYGGDYTGRYLDEIEFGDRRAAVLHDYTTCRDTGQPYISEHSFWTSRKLTVRVERVILPLSEDGVTVSHLLAGLEFGSVD